jgi:hypothetical protein
MPNYLCEKCNKEINLAEEPVRFFCRIGGMHNWVILTQEGYKIKFRSKHKHQKIIVQAQ